MRIDDGIRTSASVNGCPVTGIGREFNPFVDPYLAEPYGFWLRASQSHVRGRCWARRCGACGEWPKQSGCRPPASQAHLLVNALLIDGRRDEELPEVEESNPIEEQNWVYDVYRDSRGAAPIGVAFPARLMLLCESERLIR